MKKSLFRRIKDNKDAEGANSEHAMEKEVNDLTENNEMSADADNLAEEAKSGDGGGDKKNEAANIGDFRENAEVDPTYIQKIENEVKENYDKYLRAVAELENYKKRALKDRADLLKYAGENLARDLLEIADTLDLAVGRDYPGANEELVKGLQMIRSQLSALFERHSIKAESGLGKLFEPDKQEALASVPNSEQPVNTVIEEFKKTYFFKDKLLRPGQVVVTSESAPEKK